ncbi:helix-turn-helix domain-containing protein [Pigmentiphaga aceris]|uniref:Helix-turn-helix domain-containing protein n=1 Tax=Pigmentiphaga aceris TaxID=1940612 RepID=A0A5C0AST3_9BURK|nr:helix-turn-helix domain-containing protein [Pigmentiphaga aceris]QEI05349.1 helix-turn-helix domain-containing protein [Pigmentiphaga aceris]
MKPVLFIVLPELVLLDVAGPAEAFRIAATRQPDSYTLSYHGPQPTVRSASGLTIADLQPLPDQVPDNAIVVIAGISGAAMTLASAPAKAVVDWLARLYRPDGFQLMGVCAGSLFAAAAGLLQGRQCTTHHSYLDELRTLAPEARVHDNRIFVEDGNIFTSAGITAGIDLSLHLIAQQCDPRLACEVARDMVVYLRRAGQDPAMSPWLTHRNHLHPLVHRVQDAITRDPAADWTANKLAALAHTSARHLGRLFAEQAECSPLEYLHRVRLALARQMLRDTAHSVERIAEQTGFGSARQLRRVWRRYESASPAAHRHPLQ